MKRDSLKIEIAGVAEKSVPFPSFLKVADAALALLAGIDKTMSGGEAKVAWEVTALSMSSPIEMVITGQCAEGGSLVGKRLRAYAEGMGRLEEAPEVPAYFNDSLLREAKKIASALGEGISHVTFTIARRAVSPTEKTARHISALMRPVSEDASFQGTLESVSIHGRRRFSLYDTLTGEKIECRFRRAELEKVKGYLTEDATRVEVSGHAQYTRTGTPVSIDVKQIRALPREADLPQVHDLAGIDITGGMGSAEYVKRLYENR